MTITGGLRFGERPAIQYVEREVYIEKPLSEYPTRMLLRELWHRGIATVNIRLVVVHVDKTKTDKSKAGK
jgi:hypothetical protein